MPITSPGNDDDTGENHQPTLRKNTAEPVEQTLKQNIVCTAGISMSISWALVFPRNRIVDGGKRFIRGLCRIP